MVNKSLDKPVTWLVDFNASGGDFREPVDFMTGELHVNARSLADAKKMAVAKLKGFGYKNVEIYWIKEKSKASTGRDI